MRFGHRNNGDGYVYPIDIADEHGQGRHAHQPVALLNFRATLNKADTYEGANFVIIETPTNYDPETNYFNAESIEAVTRNMMATNPGPIMVIKSTVPVDYTCVTSETLGCRVLIFPPEFLWEGSALRDNLYPSRTPKGYELTIQTSQNARVRRLWKMTRWIS